MHEAVHDGRLLEPRVGAMVAALVGARKGVLAMDARPGPPTGGAHYSFDWIGGSMLAGGRPIRLRGK